MFKQPVQALLSGYGRMVFDPIRAIAHSVIDTWDVCGDNTISYVPAGDLITITSEFDGGEFDAFTI